MANATSTVATLTTLMLSWLDDDQAGYFTASNTLSWLNMAQREVQKQLIMAGENYYVKPVETLTVVGQSDYVLPSDFLKENRLELVISGTGTSENRVPLMNITLNESDYESHDIGQPESYYIKKDRFTLLPTPQTANQVLRLYYSYKIADLTLTTDIPDIPEEYMEFLALVATYNGFIKDDRPPEILSAKIMDYKERFKQMATSRIQDASRHIVMVDDLEATGWF